MAGAVSANGFVRLLAALTPMDAAVRHGCERTQIDFVQLFEDMLELVCDELDRVIPGANGDGGVPAAVWCCRHDRSCARAIATVGKGPVEHHHHSGGVRNSRTLPLERRRVPEHSIDELAKDCGHDEIGRKGQALVRRSVGKERSRDAGARPVGFEGDEWS